MKKIIHFIVGSTFSLIINAQTLYVKNSTNIGPLDVYSIKKFGISCSGSSNCLMSDMIGISAGNSASQVYPSLCASVPDLALSFDYNGGTIINQQFCGTPQSGTIGGANWDLYSIGTGSDVLLYIH